MAELDEIREILGIADTNLSVQQVIYTMQDRIERQDTEIKRLRAALIQHVVFAEYGNSPQFPLMGYICQICNGKGDKPDDLIHMGDCPLYDAEKDATEAGTVD